MKKILSFISSFALALAINAQGAYDFKINEVYVMSDGVEQSYKDEYGEAASWIEIENTSYSTHDIRNCFITTDRKALDENLSAPEREKLMSEIVSGDPRTSLTAKQRITFFVDGNKNRGTLHTSNVVKLVPGKSNWVAIYDGNGVDLLDSITIPPLEAGYSYARINDKEWQKCKADEVTPNAPNAEYHNNKIKEFKEKDPHGIAMTLMCMSVVFGCLVLLFVFFHIFGWAMARIAKLARVKAIRAIHEKAAKVVVMAKEGTTETKGIEMENYAAVIGLALHEYFGGTHDIESGIITITHEPSTWADKSHELRTIPQVHQPAEMRK